MDAVAHRLAGDRTGAGAGGAGLAVGRNRKLEHDVRTAVAHAPDMAGMVAARLSAPTPMSTAIPAACSRAWPAPATSGLGSSSAETTRAMPAAMMASAQGGDLP